jgi:hypothetical protein
MMPTRFFYAAVDRVEADGSRLEGVAVSGACLSARGARKAIKRVRKRHPDAYLLMRRMLEARS